MKKTLLLLLFLVFSVFLIFGDTGAQEEIDFLLFLPNSSSQFVSAERAVSQLDNLAKYILGKDLVPGQIYVYGYTAEFQNDIDEMELSRNRALFVMGELQKRGVSKDLFSDPIGYGSVDLWGSNIGEADKSPNRRVRIVLDGTIVTTAVLEAEEAEVKPLPVEIVIEEVTVAEEPKSKSRSAFPWWILLAAAIIALIIFLLAKRRKRAAGIPIETAREIPLPASPPAPRPAPVSELIPVAEPIAAPVVIRREIVVDLEEEIRFRAYELYLERGGQNGDADGDWYMAVCQICAKYEAKGYQSGFINWRWQASRWV